MAEKKDKDKDKTSDYNKQKVVQKPYYYDRDVTDGSLQKEFGDLMSKLKSLNKSLTKELAKPGKPADLEIKKKS